MSILGIFKKKKPELPELPELKDNPAGPAQAGNAETGVPPAESVMGEAVEDFQMNPEDTGQPVKKKSNKVSLVFISIIVVVALVGFIVSFVMLSGGGKKQKTKQFTGMSPVTTPAPAAPGTVPAVDTNIGTNPTFSAMPAALDAPKDIPKNTPGPEVVTGVQTIPAIPEAGKGIGEAGREKTGRGKADIKAEKEKAEKIKLEIYEAEKLKAEKLKDKERVEAQAKQVDAMAAKDANKINKIIATKELGLKSTINPFKEKYLAKIQGAGKDKAGKGKGREAEDLDKLMHELKPPPPPPQAILPPPPPPPLKLTIYGVVVGKNGKGSVAFTDKGELAVGMRLNEINTVTAITLSGVEVSGAGFFAVNGKNTFSGR